MNNSEGKYKLLIDNIDALIEELNLLKGNVLDNNIQAANNYTGSIIGKFEELKNKITECSSKRNEVVEDSHLIEMNIYDAIPMLKEMLNIKGVCENLLGKKANWMNDKMNKKSSLGFTEQSVEMMNQAMRDVVDICRAHILRLPSEYSEKEIYAKYAIQILKELRSVISMPYLRENYTSMAKDTLNNKIRLAIGKNGKPCYFTEKNIIEINTGITQMADTFSRLRFTL